MTRRISSPRALFCAACLLLAAGCGDDPTVEDGGILLLARPAGADALTDKLVTDLEAYLKKLSPLAPVVKRAALGNAGALQDAAEEARAGLVLVLDSDKLAPGHALPGDYAKLSADAFALVAKDSGDWANKLGSRGATFLHLIAWDKLGLQYAAYEALRRLGVRFYHPEEEYIPSNDPLQLRKRAATATAVGLKKDGTPHLVLSPDFAWRSYSFHGSHPLEHLEAFSDGNHAFDEAQNVNEWVVKNRGNKGKGLGRGIADQAARDKRSKELSALHTLLGFKPGGPGITLHNQQQGANAVVDLTKSTPPKQQIEQYVAARMAGSTKYYSFGIHFGPTEFTTTPDKQTIDWINWAGRKAIELQPDIRVIVNDHTTGSQAVDNYSDLGCPPGTNQKKTCDYYDLAFHTDSRFAAKVHTVMFYPLEGPANVYNQKTFAHKLCLMKKASAQGRPLVWFPEGSWWLSFDNPIPVYLPLYIWTRGRDIELVRDLLTTRGTGTLNEHRMFNSGHAWGYWQQDYAVGMWHWNADVTMDQVLGEILDPLCKPAEWETGCAARTEALALMSALMKHQKDFLMDKKDWQGLAGGLFAYMSGEDPADEIAAVTGFEFQPVRVAFSKVATWTDKQLAHFRKTDMAALDEMYKAYLGWTGQLTAMKAKVPTAGQPWLAEILDGVENNALRALHTHQLYDAVLTFREAVNKGSADTKTAAKAKLDKAAATLKLAQAVIRRREEAYRYPAKQMYGGGVTAATAVNNGTTYPYRVHTKTHLLTYWNNRQARAVGVIEGKSSSNQLDMSPALAAPGSKLKFSWPKQAGLTADVTVGTNKVTTKDTELDLGTTEGFWAVAGKLTVGGADVPVKGGVARTKSRAKTPAKGLTLITPKDPLAQTVLNPLFPVLQWGVLSGTGSSSGALVFGADLLKSGDPGYQDLVYAAFDSSSTATAFTTKPVTVKMPFPSPAGGGQASRIGLADLTFKGSLTGGKLASPVRLEANMVLDDLVKILIDMAGFDKAGALKVLAGVLGFDVNKPPTSVKVVGDLKVEATP